MLKEIYYNSTGSNSCFLKIVLVESCNELVQPLVEHWDCSGNHRANNIYSRATAYTRIAEFEVWIGWKVGGGRRSGVSGRRSGVSGRRSGVSGRRSGVSGRRSGVSGVTGKSRVGKLPVAVVL
jgi:hypothetical protein